MLKFPNSKINIGLNILSKRNDGYHNIETIFFPLQFSDILEIVPSESFSFKNTGIDVGTNYENNLVYKAYKLVKERYKIPEISIHLHKIIPTGAGLGGGSSDAVSTLKLLNEIFCLNIDKKTMSDLCNLLGSDCNFFLENKVSFAFEKGNLFSKTNISLKGYYLVLVYPNISINTKFAYKSVKPALPEFRLSNIKNIGIEDWKRYIINDFEKTIFIHHPEISRIKEIMYSNGAVFASMSGSGSSVYGFFAEDPQINNKFKNYFYYSELMDK
ncbi:MAG: 4-(cytidine 5'-diphospho)-2-C-methyl-D-erythritol kinase [Bacteroidota bacterium]